MGVLSKEAQKELDRDVAFCNWMECEKRGQEAMSCTPSTGTYTGDAKLYREGCPELYNEWIAHKARKRLGVGSD